MGFVAALYAAPLLAHKVIAAGLAANLIADILCFEECFSIFLYHKQIDELLV